MNADITQTNVWAVGCWPDKTPKSFFKGNVDEVSFWNRALTTAEIQSIYANTQTVNPNDMVSYWNFNEGTGNTLIDLKGFSNGARNGAAYSADTPY
jgi:hypothetical protein